MIFDTIQIQHLLKLNYGYGGKPNVGTGIQIQHLLKLNLSAIITHGNTLSLFKYNIC